LVDASTPKLFSITNEGRMIWSDEADYTFDCEYLMNYHGEVIIGTEDKPYMHKLTITFHGDKDDR
jgi:hypothetical protein